MSKGKFIINASFILMLVLTALGNTPMVAQAGNGNDELKADPRLLQMAEENPDAIFMVIVQKDAKNKDLKDMEVEDEVLKGGGQVKKQLDIIVSFSAEMTGREITKLAKHPKVRWISADAPMVSSSQSNWVVGDKFDIVSYGNNYGTASWATQWIESGDDGNPSTGYIGIKADAFCTASTCLEIDPKTLNSSVSRGINLANATIASLVFTFNKAGGAQIVLEVSTDDGASWTSLATFSGSVGTTSTFDLTPYRSATTQIRFRVASTGNGELWVDNLLIKHSTSSSDLYNPTDRFVDEFATVSYSGSNGTQSWTGNLWTEGGESDGTGSGKVRVLASPQCYSGNCLRIGGQNVSITNVAASRKADLSKAYQATLSFQYRRDVTYATSANVSIQASSDGTNWTTLATYTFMGIDTASVSESFDITPYKSANTRIRFVGSGTAGASTGYAYLYVDEVNITYTLPSTFVQATQAQKLRQQNASATGQGVTVAIVDSGITSHPDLQGRILANNNQTTAANTNDDYVHGTHVAGIVGGNGSVSNGARLGMAPNANLINVKVCNDQGVATASDLVNGLQWILNNKAAYNIKVVNISLNSTIAESYHTSPLDAAVEILWFNGIVVVVSAGNNGTGSGPVSLYPPANDPFVITVGAAEDKGTPALSDDTVAAFSAYGTTENSFAKPDLVAPGRNIVSLLAGTNTTGFINHPLNRIDQAYFRMSGTSMSAPMVAGAVALLLQDEPNLNPDQVKYRLMATANKTWSGYNATKAGAGYLDIYAAVYGTTTQSTNTGIVASNMLSTGSTPITWGSVGWNSVGWNSVGWNSVGWNSVGWNSVGWNSIGWNSSIWDQ